MIRHTHKEIKKHTRFYLLMSILLALLMVRYGLQVGIPRIVITAMIAIIALLGDRDEILAISMCCIPLHEAVDFFYALVACAGIYVLKNYRRFRINLAVCLVLLIIMWELLHCFEPSFSLVTFLITVVPLIFLAVILCADVSETDYDFVVRVMAVVVVSTCAILLMNLIVRADFNIISALEGLRRLGFTEEEQQQDVMLGGTLNPNALGIICVLSAAGLVQIRAAQKEKKSDIILLILLLSFGALTSSRTYLVCLFVMIVLMILGQPGYFQRKIRLLMSMLMLLGISVLLLRWLFPELLEYYIKRFQKVDISSGRNALMLSYHDYITDNVNVMLFGIGRHNFAEKLTEIYRIAQNVPHNSIQEIIIAWGLPGLIMFVLMILMLLKQARKYNRKPILLNYIPLLIILVKSMAGQLLTSGYTMLALSYAYLSLCQNFQVKEKV